MAFRGDVGMWGAPADYDFGHDVSKGGVGGWSAIEDACGYPTGRLHLLG